MRRRLFISDLDGTLLLPDRTLGARSRAAIERLLAAGALFTVATGRSAASTATIVGGLALPVEAIVHNGAARATLSTLELSGVAPIPAAAAGGVFRAALAVGMAPLAYAVDGARTVLLHGGAENEATARYLEALGALHRCQRDDHGGAVAALPVLNMLLLDDPQRLRAFLGARCGRGSGLSATLSKSAYTTGLGVAELQAADASKATAALALAREHGVGAADIVAFGDNLNDLELLLAAGEARCPPDAAPEVLAAIAGRIAPTAEEGVARYLEELLAEAR